jgi:hypothetical protein
MSNYEKAITSTFIIRYLVFDIFRHKKGPGNQPGPYTIVIHQYLLKNRANISYLPAVAGVGNGHIICA